MSNQPLLSQLEVEQLTGLSREVLRKWEIRYDFPTPVRGPRGQRLYSRDTVERLQLIRRLMGQGLRPGGLVALPIIALRELLVYDCGEQEAAIAQARGKLLACLMSDAEPMAIRSLLQEIIDSEGLSNFVEWYYADFNASVGQAWARGDLAIHAEHHYSESVRKVVMQALSALPRRADMARVLLTTPPHEIHGLGLLGVEATLALRGADCLCLGVQTPAENVAQAAIGFRVSVVAISISECYPESDAASYILELRNALPQEMKLWVGGRGASFLQSKPIEGVKGFTTTVEAGIAWDALF